MKAIVQDTYGAPERVLRLDEIEDESPAELSEIEEEYAASILKIDQRSIRQIAPLLNANASEYISNPSPDKESFETLAEVSSQAAALTDTWAKDVEALSAPDRFMDDHDRLVGGLESLAERLREIGEWAVQENRERIDQVIDEALADQGRAAAEPSTEFSRFVPGFLSIGA